MSYEPILDWHFDWERWKAERPWDRPLTQEERLRLKYVYCQMELLEIRERAVKLDKLLRASLGVINYSRQSLAKPDWLPKIRHHMRSEWLRIYGVLVGEKSIATGE